MTTKSRRKSASKSDNANPQAQNQPQKSKKPSFVSRYIGIDSHLTERNGAAGLVFGMAAERPAGRKLADDIARQCVQLDAEGYEIISIFPLTSGRSAKAAVESEERVNGRTYTKQVQVQEPNSYWPRTTEEHYVDTGVGYSVTDGVVITAKLRK